MVETGIYYYNNHPNHILKLVGELRFDQSQAMFDVLDHLKQEQKLESLEIDLNDVSLLDSTMLGVITELGVLFLNHSRNKPLILCSNDDLKKIISVMGINQIFQMDSSPSKPHAFKKLSVTFDKRAVEAGVLKAHERLMTINDKNKEEFSNLVDMLKKQINND